MKSSSVLSLALLLACGVVEAQENPGSARKVIHIKHVSPYAIQLALEGWSGIRSSNELGVIVVRGPANHVAEVEKAIAELDTPAKSDRRAYVELTVHYLGASESGPAADIQGPLADVVAELKKNFPYESYRVLETAMLNTRQGHETSMEGIIPGEAESADYVSYGIDVTLRGISRSASPAVVELDKLKTFVRLPIPNGEGGFNFHNLVIDTAIDIPEGKMVVVGKAGARGPANSIFVVLQARVVG